MAAAEEVVEAIRKAFEKFLKRHEEIEAILLYGSYARGEQTPRSDIDVCLVIPAARRDQERAIRILREVWREVDLDPSKYDIRVFELLPLYIQVSIIKNHKVIWAKSLPDLYEYFYFNYLKIWKDQEQRYAETTYA